MMIFFYSNTKHYGIGVDTNRGHLLEVTLLLSSEEPPSWGWGDGCREREPLGGAFMLGPGG